jgi:hypothetical protein
MARSYIAPPVPPNGLHFLQRASRPKAIGNASMIDLRAQVGHRPPDLDAH